MAFVTWQKCHRDLFGWMNERLTHLRPGFWQPTITLANADGLLILSPWSLFPLLLCFFALDAYAWGKKKALSPCLMDAEAHSSRNWLSNTPGSFLEIGIPVLCSQHKGHRLKAPVLFLWLKVNCSFPIVLEHESVLWNSVLEKSTTSILSVITCVFSLSLFTLEGASYHVC